MKNRKVKLLLTALCVLASGLCYSCNGVTAGTGDKIVLDSSSGGSASDHKAAEAEDDEESSLQNAEAIQGEAVPGDETQPAEQPVTEELCYVHICGEVVTPGVYGLREGSRVYEAIEKAGGFTQQGATDYLNMAETVSDGMKIVVPNLGELDKSDSYGDPGSGNGAFAGVAGVSGKSQPSGKVNLNTATKEQLMTLKGIGESRAEDILRYREQHGGFKKIEDIMKVSGIKDAAFQKIRDDITV